VKEAECSGNVMYENGKMIHTETISGVGGEDVKKNEGEFNNDVF
jgi:hypothetical protein